MIGTPVKYMSGNRFEELNVILAWMECLRLSIFEVKNLEKLHKVVDFRPLFLFPHGRKCVRASWLLPTSYRSL